MDQRLRKYQTQMREELCSIAFYRDVFVEILATFILMTFQCCLPLPWDKGDPPAMFGSIVQQGLGMGFMVCSTSWAFGDFGGCIMNPAVTVGMMVYTRITVLRALFYIPAQCIGALLGAGFIYVLTPASRQGTFAATLLHPELDPWQGVLIEIWLTFFLLCVILGTTNERRKGNLYLPTIVIGFAVTLAVLSGSAQTGASMNPARSLGPAVVKGIWEHHWIYWVGPMVGAVMGALVYTVLDYVDRPPKQTTTKTGKAFEEHDIAKPVLDKGNYHCKCKD